MSDAPKNTRVGLIVVAGAAALAALSLGLYFRAQARIILGTKPGRWEDIAIGYARRSFEPLFASPYRIEPAFVAGLVADVRSRKLEVVRLGKGEFTPPPPGMLFMNRLQFGFYSVLAKLDAAVDYVAVERGFLGPI